jgi:hypothetical protein
VSDTSSPESIVPQGWRGILGLASTLVVFEHGVRALDFGVGAFTAKPALFAFQAVLVALIAGVVAWLTLLLGVRVARTLGPGPIPPPLTAAAAVSLAFLFFMIPAVLVRAFLVDWTTEVVWGLRTGDDALLCSFTPIAVSSAGWTNPAVGAGFALRQALIAEVAAAPWALICCAWRWRAGDRATAPA